MNTQDLPRIQSLIVTVNGTPYIYECHTAQKAAEILAATVALMKDTDRLDSFQVC